MGLFCTNCRNPVPEGVNQCRVCNNGFVHELACSQCGRSVIRGAAFCACTLFQRPSSYQPPDFPEGFQVRSPEEVPTRALSRRTSQNEYGQLTYGETFDGAGRFGAISDVTVPDGVASVLGDISRTVQTLLSLANKLATVAGTERSRECIRGCRDLASRLQEELETRRGPSRG